MAGDSRLKLYCNNLDCEYNNLDSEGKGYCTTEEVVFEKDEEEKCDDYLVCWKCGLDFEWKAEYGLFCPYCDEPLKESDILEMGPYMRMYCKTYRKLWSKRKEEKEN